MTKWTNKSFRKIWCDMFYFSECIHKAMFLEHNAMIRNVPRQSSNRLHERWLTRALLYFDLLSQYRWVVINKYGWCSIYLVLLSPSHNQRTYVTNTSHACIVNIYSSIIYILHMNRQRACLSLAFYLWPLFLHFRYRTNFLFEKKPWYLLEIWLLF